MADYYSEVSENTIPYQNIVNTVNSAIVGGLTIKQKQARIFFPMDILFFEKEYLQYKESLSDYQIRLMHNVVQHFTYLGFQASFEKSIHGIFFSISWENF